MAQQLVNIGTVANDGTGDTLRDAFDITNENFTELYTDKSPLASPTFTGTATIPTLNLTNALAVAYGGTGAASTSGVGGALDNLFPSGEVSGYVLKTSGAGTYYWGAETGAGGTVGTKIDTTRQSYTATSGQTVFDLTSTTYTPGTGQLRVYINGVRQHPAAYTETDTNTFTLSTGVTTGTLVFAEVDGYVSYPIAATDISYSPAGGSSIAGGTVQLAITELESEKAPKASPAFTGTVTGITATMVSLGNVTNESKSTMFTSPTFTGTTTLQQSTEVLNTKTSATGTVTHDFSTGAVFYHSSISANFTANFTNVPTTNNRTIVVSLILAQGVTARIPSAVQIDGSAQTIKWQDNTVPTGNASKVDIVSFSLIRTGSAWTVLGGLSTYG